MRIKSSSLLKCMAALNGMLSQKSVAQKQPEMMSSSSMRISRKATAILNGVVGDYLDASGNELSLEMGFYKKGSGHLLDLSSVSFSVHDKSDDVACGDGDDDDDVDEAKTTKRAATMTSSSKKKICILVHGLTDDESAWEFESKAVVGGDYGSFLHRDFGASPLYVRYNTGLHISTNGHKLNNLMNELMASSCLNNDDKDNDDACEIMFVCHSMGGLVTRSALHYGVEEKSLWVSKVTRVVFLGTPHQGSLWEQLGNAVSRALGSVPLPYMKLAEKTANLRSAGIKDLRYGYILDEDWQTNNEHDDTVEDDSFLKQNTKKRAHFVDSIAYYVVTGTVTSNPRHLLSQWIGDALVQKASAEGRSDSEEHHLNFNPENFCEFAGVGHIQLARDPAVYEQIKTWLDMPLLTSLQQQAPTRSSSDTSTGGTTVFDQLKTQNPVSTWAKRKGVASLIQDAVGNGATAVEGVHMALTDETFDILCKVKPISHAVKKIKTVHDWTVGGVYSIIRGVSDSLTEIAKITCEVMDEEEETADVPPCDVTDQVVDELTMSEAHSTCT